MEGPPWYNGLALVWWFMLGFSPVWPLREVRRVLLYCSVSAMIDAFLPDNVAVTVPFPNNVILIDPDHGCGLYMDNFNHFIFPSFTLVTIASSGRGFYFSVATHFPALSVA